MTNKAINIFSFAESSLNLNAGLRMEAKSGGSPFDRFDGFTVTMVEMTSDAPHDGEMHPDGDEAIYVLSGCLQITLEFEPPQTVKVEVGEGIVIPKGVWHKVHVLETAKIFTISPGPGFEFRPKS